jgi:hypothetical protein
MQYMYAPALCALALCAIDTNAGTHLLIHSAAENFTMITRSEIQSEYWISKQVTLFIGISQHLDISVWKDSVGKVDKSQEVTIAIPDAKPFFAVVEEDFVPDVDTNEVIVRDLQKNVHRIKREFVHARRIVGIAHVIVSDDRHHDSAFVQVAMPRVKKWLSTHGSKYGCGAITEEFVRSDGAGSHFKNKYTMYYLTKYKVQFGLGRSTWCIGCPSHGKGPWWVPSRDFSDIISTYCTPHPLDIYVGMDWLAR